MTSQKYYFNKEFLNLIQFQNETCIFFNNLKIEIIHEKVINSFNYKKLISFYEDMDDYNIISKKYNKDNFTIFANKLISIVKEYKNDLEQNFDNLLYTNFQIYQSIINKFYNLKPLIFNVFTNKNLLIILNSENYDIFHNFLSISVDFFVKKDLFITEYNKKILEFSLHFSPGFIEDFIKNNKYIESVEKRLKKNLKNLKVDKIVVKKNNYFLIVNGEYVSLSLEIIKEKSLKKKKALIINFFSVYFGFFFYFKHIFVYNYFRQNIQDLCKIFDCLTTIEKEFSKDIIVYKNITKLELIKDELSTDKKCIVCYENKSIIAFSCGHKYTCSTCSINIIDTTNKCPNCRMKIINVIRIFD
jgi:hypothetical protein